MCAAQLTSNIPASEDGKGGPWPGTVIHGTWGAGAGGAGANWVLQPAMEHTSFQEYELVSAMIIPISQNAVRHWNAGQDPLVDIQSLSLWLVLLKLICELMTA